MKRTYLWEMLSSRRDRTTFDVKLIHHKTFLKFAMTDPIPIKIKVLLVPLFCPLSKSWCTTEVEWFSFTGFKHRVRKTHSKNPQSVATGCNQFGLHITLICGIVIKYHGYHPALPFYEKFQTEGQKSCV